MVDHPFDIQSGFSRSPPAVQAGFILPAIELSQLVVNVFHIGDSKANKSSHPTPSRWVVQRRLASMVFDFGSWSYGFDSGWLDSALPSSVTVSTTQGHFRSVENTGRSGHSPRSSATIPASATPSKADLRLAIKLSGSGCRAVGNLASICTLAFAHIGIGSLCSASIHAAHATRR